MYVLEIQLLHPPTIHIIRIHNEHLTGTQTVKYFPAIMSNNNTADNIWIHFDTKVEYRSLWPQRFSESE